MIECKPHQIFDYVQNYIPKDAVIVQAGAYRGRDTLQLADRWPLGTIHAFEPVPEIFADLQKAVQGKENIRCYEIALGVSNGMVSFYPSYNPRNDNKLSQAGSLLKPQERLRLSELIFGEPIQLPCITLDTWAQQHGIKGIDFALLDLQGAELAVLKAAPHMLATMSAIVMEVNFTHAYENQPLYPEICEWMSAQGFRAMARDFPVDTTWFFGNVLFVRE